VVRPCRLPFGLKVLTGDGWRTAQADDELFRGDDGAIDVMMAGRLQRIYPPDMAPEPWNLSISLFHAHGDVSRSYSVVMSQTGGRIDAMEVGQRIGRFLASASRPNDVTVEIELKPQTARGRQIMPGLEELKARAGEVIVLEAESG
jgi:hypothetical protein